MTNQRMKEKLKDVPFTSSIKAPGKSTEVSKLPKDSRKSLSEAFKDWQT